MRTTEQISALISRTADGDRDAFSELYEATSAKLFAVTIRILGRRELAEDVLQDVYVKIWERAADFDKRKASPITWMAVIARNRALDEVRRKTAISIEDAPETLEIAATTLDPLTGLERSEAYKRLLACLEQLDEERRQMVLLAYFRGMTRDALAQRFAKPVATVKTWLHRSLTQLKGCVGS